MMHSSKMSNAFYGRSTNRADNRTFASPSDVSRQVSTFKNTSVSVKLDRSHSVSLRKLFQRLRRHPKVIFFYCFSGKNANLLFHSWRFQPRIGATNRHLYSTSYNRGIGTQSQGDYSRLYGRRYGQVFYPRHRDHSTRITSALCRMLQPHPSRLQSLRQFLRRPDAEFSCPEQAVLLELMCRGQESVLGILGTGKAKRSCSSLRADVCDAGNHYRCPPTFHPSPRIHAPST